MSGGLSEGATFGDYCVVRRLGRGGMGEVWLLENASGGQLAAKILTGEADHESRKRFLREAELALGVKHPNLVEVFDVGEDPDTGLCYILMEYVPGGTLADVIKDVGPLPIEDAIAVVKAMALVLEMVREKGVVHRDIKPANIMFGADGTPKLADLGIARGGIGGTDTTTVTQTGVMIGTPAYMAPEQMLDAHHVDTRADIYSLGVVFFEMLTGQRPNKDDTIVQLMAKAVKGEPLPDVRTLRPEVSASLAQLLNMMVVPNKDGRISTPGQITSALDKIGRGGTLESPAEAERRCVARRSRRRKRRIVIVSALATAALVGLSGIAVGVWWLTRENRPTVPGGRISVETPDVREKEIAPPVVESPGIDEEVRLDVKASCANSTATVRAWTAETLKELKRQMGTAYDEKLEKVETEIVVGKDFEFPTSGWVKLAPGLGERFVFASPRRTASLYIAEGWEGFPRESAYGHFAVFAAQMASGFHYDTARAESSPIAWGLKDALGLTVARRLGHGAAADKWLAYLRARAERVANSKGVGISDVTLEAQLRPGAVPKNPNAPGDYVWIVEYRVAKLFDDLMRERPDVMHDYFVVRNLYRSAYANGGAVARISPREFAALLGKAMKRDMVAELNRQGFCIVPETKTAAPRKQPTRPKEDRRVRLATVGDHEWCYTLEDDKAVIWRNERGYSNWTRPAISPTPFGHVEVPSELDGHPVKAIGSLAFYECREVTSVTIPEGVERIDHWAFLRCRKLQAVNVPASLRIISDEAFDSCDALEAFDLKRCEEFSGRSFAGCRRLSKLVIPADRKEYITIDGALYAEGGARLVFWPRTNPNVLLPAGVTTIGRGAFHSCPVQRLVLPGSVKKIEFRAFALCNDLRDVVMEEGLADVESDAFICCRSLQMVVFPASLRQLGYGLFNWDEKLEVVAFRGNAPNLTASQRSIFDKVPESAEVLVLKGSTGWKTADSDELPKLWPEEKMADSRSIRAVSAEEIEKLVAGTHEEQHEKSIDVILDEPLAEIVRLYETPIGCLPEMFCTLSKGRIVFTLHESIDRKLVVGRQHVEYGKNKNLRNVLRGICDEIGCKFRVAGNKVEIWRDKPVAEEPSAEAREKPEGPKPKPKDEKVEEPAVAPVCVPKRVPMARVPAVVRKLFEWPLSDLNTKWHGNEKRGCLVYGKLDLAGAKPTDIATWVDVQQDGTFALALHPSRKVTFLRHGYEPMVIDVPAAREEFDAREAFDLGTLKMREPERNRAGTLQFALTLPAGVPSAKVEVRIKNNSPVRVDWAGGKDTSAPAMSMWAKDGQQVVVGDCAAADYEIRLEADGCASRVVKEKVAVGETRGVGVLELVRIRKARFLIRPFAGGAWTERSVIVDGRNKLLLQDKKDELGNTCNMRVTAYGVQDGIGLDFPWGPDSYVDYGVMDKAEFDRRSKDGSLPEPQNVQVKGWYRSLQVGHVYRHQEHNHWKHDLVLVFLDMKEVGGVPGAVAPAAAVPAAVAPPPVDNRKIDISKIKGGTLVKQLQNGCKQMFPEWSVGSDYYSRYKGWAARSPNGYYSQIFGRKHALGMPIRMGDAPFTVRKKIGKESKLRMSFAMSSEIETCEVSVMVNRKVRVGRICLTETETWCDAEVDLSAYAGKNVRLDVVITSMEYKTVDLPPGGRHAWVLYFNALDFVAP